MARDIDEANRVYKAKWDVAFALGAAAHCFRCDHSWVDLRKLEAGLRETFGVTGCSRGVLADLFKHGLRSCDCNPLPRELLEARRREERNWVKRAAKYFGGGECGRCGDQIIVAEDFVQSVTRALGLPPTM